MFDALLLSLVLTGTPQGPALVTDHPAIVWVGEASPQAVPIKNPSGIAFTCPDHDRDDQHELDIVKESDGSLLQTLLLGDPPASATGEVVGSINVQPIAFGQYRFVLRAVAGALKSENSLPSDIWERVPGRPSMPIPR